MKQSVVHRLYGLIGCALLLQSLDPLRSIVYAVWPEGGIHPHGQATLTVNLADLLFRIVAGYLYLFRAPGTGVHLVTIAFLLLRALSRMLALPVLLARFHEGLLNASRVVDVIDAGLTAAVACCVLALLIDSKLEPNKSLVPTPGSASTDGDIPGSGAAHL